MDAIVAALTGKDKPRPQPTGAYAANLVGLSDQVPAPVEFLPDGTAAVPSPTKPLGITFSAAARPTIERHRRRSRRRRSRWG